MQSIKFNDSFFLTIKDVNSTKEELKKPKQLPTNFICIIDVSGSMSGDLQFIRKQLKNKLPNLIKEGDTVSIIWFSGKHDAGILKEEVEIKSLKSLQDLNDAIDKFLKPIGLTAFHKPLVLASESIQRIKKNRPNSTFSLIFLTDGYNNDCSWSDVTKSLKTLEPDLAASTFVEYGYYADSKAISQMAELIGGEKIEAQKFDDYDVVFANKIQKTYSSSKKVLIDIPNNRKFDFAFTLGEDNEIILYSINNDQALVPENTTSLLFFTSSASSFQIYNNTNDETLNKLLYGSVYVLSEKLQTEHVDDVFKVLGDQQLYKTFSNAFGKQKLFAFKGLVKECVSNPSKQFLNGRSTNLVLDENAYCVMDFINDLISDESALFYPLHDEFDYNRISAKRVAKKTDELNEAQKNKIASANTKEELQTLIDQFESTGDLKFEYPDKSVGYPIDGLVWSSDRANLSIRIKYDGSVILPKNNFGLNKFNTFVYRTYTIIKDGILNVSKLPVSISFQTWEKFKTAGLITDEFFVKPLIDGVLPVSSVVIIDFSSLPVINRKMVKLISAKKLGLLEYELLQNQALEKVYKYFETIISPKKSVGFIEKYGSEVEQWLKGLSITESNGFAQSSTTEKGTDFYMAIKLDTKIAKHSALPSVEAVLKKITAGSSLNAVDNLLKVAIDDCNSQINSKLYTELKDDELKSKILSNWLSSVRNTANLKRKQLLQEIAQIKFSLILSKKWFEEFNSFDEDTININVDGQDLTVKFEMSEKQIDL